MARPIDGDRLVMKLNNLFEKGLISSPDDVEDAINDMPTLPPPPAPLTLEELRGMDGEAVFVVVDGLEPLKIWALIKVEEESVWLTNNLGGRTEYAADVELEEDEVTVYRRPPEVEE